jgi:hypothetical protein
MLIIIFITCIIWALIAFLYYRKNIIFYNQLQGDSSVTHPAIRESNRYNTMIKIMGVLNKIFGHKKIESPDE